MKTGKFICPLLIFGFLLGIHKGKIAIWGDFSKEPLHIFPYSASQLPDQDRKKLESGLHFDTLNDLKNFIENYNG